MLLPARISLSFSFHKKTSNKMRFFDCQPLRKRGDRERMPTPTFQDKEVKFKKGKEEIFREFYFLAYCFHGGFSKKYSRKCSWLRTERVHQLKKTCLVMQLYIFLCQFVFGTFDNSNETKHSRMCFPPLSLPLSLSCLTFISW